jgi:branched-chain amino acid transport system substrate-binding protein
MNAPSRGTNGGSRRVVTTLAGLTTIGLLLAGCSARVGSDTSTDGAAEASGGDLTADCLQYEPTTGITDDAIKVGTSLPVTGPLATAGTSRFGTQAYFDYVNANGGVDGRSIELVIRDDAYDPSKTTTNVNELVNDEKVFAMVSLLGTANVLAVQQDLQDNCIPNLLVQTGAPVVSTPEQTWTVPQFPTYTLEAEALAAAAEASGVKTVSIISQNDDFGKAYVEGLTGALDGTGITVTKQLTYDVGAPSVDSQITQLADDGADAVLVAALGTKCPQIFNGINASGWTPQLLVGTLCTTKGLLTLLEPGAGADMISTAWYKSPSDEAWADDEAMQTYRDAVAEYTPEADPNEDFVLDGWLLGQVFVDLLESADTLDRAGVMEAARTADLHVDTMLDGIQFVTGDDKFEPIDSVQLQRYDADATKMVFIDPETADDLPSGETKLTSGAAEPGQ